jgi:hypothetical protein
VGCPGRVAAGVRHRVCRRSLGLAREALKAVGLTMCIYAINIVDGATGLASGGASETQIAAVSISGTNIEGTYSTDAWYNYFYDSKNRRRIKVYPSGISDEYFYDSSDELIYDQGNQTIVSPSDYTEDNYIWLGGRPVAMIHGQLTARTWARQCDGNANCNRDDVGACGVYFVVTDPIGRVARETAE